MFAAKTSRVVVTRDRQLGRGLVECLAMFGGRRARGARSRPAGPRLQLSTNLLQSLHISKFTKGYSKSLRQLYR